MPALDDFDRALGDSSQADGNAWADAGFSLLSAVATKLTEQDLARLRTLWPNRPLLWQQHCAEVLGANRLYASIEILMAMVDQGAPNVGLAALESLREFDPKRFSLAQTARILVALDARLGQPIELLHRVVLEAFAATLHMDGPDDRMSASLLRVVEVDRDERIRCQAPGCVKTVHKRIHVVQDGDRIVVVGSDCWGRLYAGVPGTNVTARYGVTRGRKLTAEERALLLENTLAFVARMEEEAAAAARAEAKRADAEAERSCAAPPERPQWQPPPIDPDDPPYVAPEDRQRPRQSPLDALRRFREQEAHRVARELVARAPAFQRFPERWIARAMLRAKEDCIASGLKLDEPGSRQRIEAGALELLKRHYRP